MVHDPRALSYIPFQLPSLENCGPKTRPLTATDNARVGYPEDRGAEANVASNAHVSRRSVLGAFCV